MKLKWSFLIFAIISMQLQAHENNSETKTAVSKKIGFKNIMVSLGPYKSINDALKNEKLISWNEELKLANAITTAFAASEIKSHFALTGNQLNVIEYNPTSINKTIVIIERNLLKHHHPSVLARVDLDKLGNQGYALLRQHNALFIVANSRIGRMYGAYELLRKAGFEWYNTSETCVPKRFTKDISSYETIQVPAIKYRGFWTFAKDPISEDYLLWLARNQFNLVGKTDEYLAKKLGFKVWAGTHSLIQEEFSKAGLFEKYPEWFTLYKGERLPVTAKGQYINPSFSNQEAAEYFSAQLIQRLQTGDLKHIDILNLWPTDKKNIRIDESDSARALGNFSDTLLYFYSIVAKKINEAHSIGGLNRKIILAGISYHYTMQAPENMISNSGLSKNNYLHIYYPSSRDWSTSISHELENSTDNMSLTTSINNWSNNTDFSTGFVDYNLKSNYAGIAITNHHNIAQDFDYYFQHNVDLYGYMHAVKVNPGPLELTNTLISRLCWKPNSEISAMLVKEKTEAYFSDKYGTWANHWHEIYDQMMLSVSNAKQIFETGSLSTVLFQNIYWSKPPYSKEDVTKLIPRFLEGGVQEIPNGYTNSMYKMNAANFMGLHESIRIQAELEKKWNVIISQVNDKSILNSMNNDIAWFKTTSSRYRLLKLCSDLEAQHLELDKVNQIKLSILKEVNFLSESRTITDFISPVNSKGFLWVVKKYVDSY